MQHPFTQKNRIFPIGFILNTGNHSNGGIYWQALYIDHQHTAYFLIRMDENQVIDHLQKEIKTAFQNSRLIENDLLERDAFYNLYHIYINVLSAS